MQSRFFRAWPESVPDARRFVSDVLGQVPPELCQTATLLVSELATNVIRHAGGTLFEVTIDFVPEEARVWIGVTDSGDGEPVVKLPPATSENGRGLQLVGSLADRWGMRRRRGAAEKTVWFELSSPSAAPRQAN